ncbi:SGNH/GDSL hydrolase family protein [Smaragdicoccus niigatensis]|uniref:SGNH/GDSL hydrolase family protein n=1 Tax=Smaragdicoccus niigatensis TaxID=359359 RepID=UPI00036303A0|nr:SGNH/GDSL hydrolase family protein [Smaragdicoccus niigatensis]
MSSGGLSLVALGSSFASGPGIRPVVDVGAMRSGVNYPHLLASALGSQLRDVTSAGATTAHILHSRQLTLTGARPPQIEAVTRDATHVTITIGGNDLGFLASVIKVGALGRLGRVRRTTDADGVALVKVLITIVDEVRRRAPGARVLLVDYLTLIGDTPAADLPFPQRETEEMRRTERRLQESTRRAADQSGADLVTVSQTSRSHGIAAPEPWVAGWELWVPWSGRPLPFHPNTAGMRHIADEVLTHCRA